MTANFGVEVFLILVATILSILTVGLGVLAAATYTWVKCVTLILLVAILILNAAAAVVQIHKTSIEHRKEEAILQRKARLVAFLGEEIDLASQIEYRMESLMTRGSMTQEALNAFVIEVERWRTRVGNRLEEVLPGTHGARVFLAARGEFPGSYVVVGPGVSVQIAQTPGFYQYTHVRECRHGLNTILASLDSFVRLSFEEQRGP